VDQPREPLPTLVDETPALPASYTLALDEGLRAIGVALLATERAAIDGHVRMLLAWTSAINLTAIREPVAVATAHVVDSLTALPWLRAHDVPALLDLGSGGGFPGLPLAATLPETDVLLLEAVGKKARFLDTAIAAVGLGEHARVVAARAEALARAHEHRDAWSVVTARAVASTADLVELAFPLLAPGGSLIAWKRGDLAAELAAAERAVAAMGGGRVDVIPIGAPVANLADHALVVATRRVTGRVPDAYPRDPAVRARRPW
jgi:16S rRNA (guanine527-N7)-methyltransferase